MRPSISTPCSRRPLACRGRAEDRQAARPIARRGRGRARHRPRVSPADEHDRPPPRGQDRRRPARQIVLIEAKVVEHRAPPAALARAVQGAGRGRDRRRSARVLPRQSCLDEKALPVGARRWISGKLELWDGHLQMVHPDRVMDAEGLARMPRGRAGLWPDRGALAQRARGRGRAGAPAANCRSGWRGRRCSLLKLPGFAEALAIMHRPPAPEDIEPAGPARLRLAYDELLANQLALASHARADARTRRPRQRRGRARPAIRARCRSR